MASGSIANSIVKWTIWLEEVLAANDRSFSFIIYAHHPIFIQIILQSNEMRIKLWRNSPIGSIITRIIRTTSLLYACVFKFDHGNRKSHGVCKLYASFNCTFETLHVNCSRIRVHSEFYRWLMNENSPKIDNNLQISANKKIYRIYIYISRINLRHDWKFYQGIEILSFSLQKEEKRNAVCCKIGKK